MSAYNRPVLDANDPEVLLCTDGGVDHDWRPEDRTPPGVAPGNPWYVCSVCVWCRAIRCGSLAASDPCLRPRHHREPHRYRFGTTRAVGA